MAKHKLNKSLSGIFKSSSVWVLVTFPEDRTQCAKILPCVQKITAKVSTLFQSRNRGKCNCVLMDGVTIRNTVF